MWLMLFTIVLDIVAIVFTIRMARSTRALRKSNERHIEEFIKYQQALEKSIKDRLH